MPETLLPSATPRNPDSPVRRRSGAGALTRFLTLPVLVCSALLAGCEKEASLPDAVAQVGVEAARVCNVLGPATVVRFRTRVENRSQHQVHLLNSAVDLDGCSNAIPLASVVTLRYRVAGS